MKAGVNCIRYLALYSDINSKRFSAPSCDSSGANHGNTCMRSDLPFCHNVASPFLGVNCRLPACNAIPNETVRRPGVNCLADCNDKSKKAIQDNVFFFEGLNCLPSCKTTVNPNPGQNCVLEFNDYVMPFCTSENAALPRFQLNWSGDKIQRRKNCLDVRDLPLCSGSATSMVNCVNQCQNSFSAKPNVDCVAFSGVSGLSAILENKKITPKCHHYPSISGLAYDPNCEKYTCDMLSPEELSASNSPLTTDSKFCSKIDAANKPIKCSSFSQKQLNSAYLGVNCVPIDCKCDDGDLSPDLTSIAELDSFYANSFSSAYKTACSKTFGSGSAGSGEISSPCCMAGGSYCSLPSDVTQIFSCTTSQSGGQSTTIPNQSCDSGSTCSSGTCNKTRINCRTGNNAKLYSVCLANSSSIQSSGDHYVSWFFRPTPHQKSLKDYTDSSSGTSVAGKILRQMSGYPVNGQGSANGSVYYTQSDLKANGFGSDVVVDVPGLFSVNLGYGHTYIGGDDTRSPGFSHGNGLPNWISWYNRVCGMTGRPQNPPTEDFGFFQGEVSSVFTDNDEAHDVTLCLRYPNSSITTGLAGDHSTCGSRECGISIIPVVGSIISAFGATDVGNICGGEICKTVRVHGGRKFNECNSYDYVNESNLSRSVVDLVSSISSSASKAIDEVKKIDPIIDQSVSLVQSTVGVVNDLKSQARDTIDQIPVLGEVANAIGGLMPSVQGNRSCQSRFGDVGGDNPDAHNLRVRAYKPKKNDNYICAVLDVIDISGQGHFNGTEKFELEDGNVACVSGILNDQKECSGGKDTTGGDTTKWHTVGIFKYIGNIPNYFHKTSTGFFKTPKEGIIAPKNFNQYEFFKKSDCIRHPLRVGAPKYENVVDLENGHGLRMVTPNLEIIRTCKRKAANCENLDSDSSPTDFYEPMIEVGYGQNASLEPLVDSAGNPSKRHRLISVNFDSQINSPPASKSYETLENELDGIRYTSEVYLKKEDSAQPRACLYRKVKDQTDPTKYLASDELIGCVDRTKPQLNNFAEVSEPLKKIIISTNSSSYSQFSLSLRYLYFNTSGLSAADLPSVAARKSADCSSRFNGNPVLCSTQANITLGKDLFFSNFNPGNENYQLSVEREECTKLNFECVDKRIEINQKLRRGEVSKQEADTDPTMLYCQNLVISCNSKKGINVAEFNPSLVSGFNKASYGDYYGWFNEVCITSGISEVLNQKVWAKFPRNADNSFNISQMGKCEIDEVSKNPSADCSAGGKEPDCPCIKESDSISPDSQHVFRSITPREAGLCVDISVVRVCPAIAYPVDVDTQNKYFTSNSDLELVSSEIGLGSANKSPATISHQKRSQNSVADSENRTDASGNLVSYNNGHAEFEMAIAGEASIKGTCNGFWKDQTSFGVAVDPVADCNANGVWTNFRNSCQRFSCAAISVPSFGSDEFGLYPGYDTTSPIGLLGAGHGFANWPRYTKTNDVIESVSANSCLVGYRPVGATKNVGSVFGSLAATYANLNPDGKALLASVFKQNTGYSGGSLPTRQCNQLGFWRTPRNICQRITCPKTISLPQKISASSICRAPSSISSDSTEFCLTNILAMWSQVGGVIVDVDGVASLTSLASSMLNESLVSGVCAENLGFFALSAANPPKLFCDSNGNWSQIINRCQRNCDAINGINAAEIGNGFSNWLQYSSLISPTSYSSATASSCINGYYPNPYPPRKDSSGEDGIEENGSAVFGVNHVTSNVGNSIYTTTSPIGSQTKLKITIPSGADNVSSAAVLRDGFGGNEFSLKRITISGSITALRDPYVGEIEAGKTYIFQKTTLANNAGTFWIVGLAYNKNLSSDSRSASYSPAMPVRMCAFRQSAAGGVSVWTAPDSFCVNGCLGSQEDDRMGVGITEHKVSPRVHASQKVNVRWDKASFGAWQIKEFDGISTELDSAGIPFARESSTQSASAFSASARTNGSKKFILARKCNQTTKKWEDPVAFCPANSGVIDSSHNAVLNNLESGVGNYLRVGNSIAASCSSGFEYDFTKNPDGSATVNVLNYSCDFKDSNANLDEIQINSSGNSCIKTCQTSSNRSFGSTAKDPNTYDSNKPYSSKFKVNERLNLDCANSAYGYKALSSTRNIGSGENTDKLCTYSSAKTTRRNSTGPYTTCDYNGNWSLVSDGCEACRNCTTSSPVRAIIIDTSHGGTAARSDPRVSGRIVDYIPDSDYVSVQINGGSKVKLNNKENACQISNCQASEAFTLTFDDKGTDGNNNRILIKLPNSGLTHGSSAHGDYRNQHGISNNGYHEDICMSSVLSFRATTESISGAASVKCIDGQFQLGLFCKRDAGAHSAINDLDSWP